MTFKRQTIPITKRCIQIMILAMGNDISGCQDSTWRCLGRSEVTWKLRFDRHETGPRKCVSPSIPNPYWEDTLLMLVFQLEGNTGVREWSENVKTCVFCQHTEGLKNPGKHTFLKLFRGTTVNPPDCHVLDFDIAKPTCHSAGYPSRYGYKKVLERGSIRSTTRGVTHCQPCHLSSCLPLPLCCGLLCPKSMARLGSGHFLCKVSKGRLLKGQLGHKTH